MIKRNKKPIYGVAINDLDEPVSAKGMMKNNKMYNVWRDMIRRCYSAKCQTKNPTYVGCSVCKEWLSLSNFRDWYCVNYREGMALDKDILIPGNKVYCPEACRFVPLRINTLVESRTTGAINPMVGIKSMIPNAKIGRVNTTYMATCYDVGHGRMSKTFKTIPEAVSWYSENKTRIVREIVLEAFCTNKIASDVAAALLERDW